MGSKENKSRAENENGIKGGELYSIVQGVPEKIRQ